MTLIDCLDELSAEERQVIADCLNQTRTPVSDTIETVTYYQLDCSYEITEDCPWGSLDEEINTIAARYLFEGSGAGSGFGCRDLDWDRDEPLSPELLASLTEDLQTVVGLTRASYSERCWTVDEQLRIQEPVNEKTVIHVLVGEP